MSGARRHSVGNCRGCVGEMEGKKLKKQSAQGKSIHVCVQGMRKAPCKEEEE